MANLITVGALVVAVFVALVEGENKISKKNESPLSEMDGDSKSKRAQQIAKQGKIFAWTASLSKNINVWQDREVMFDKVTLNYCPGCDWGSLEGYITKGIFRAPLSGLYKVDVSITTDSGKCTNVRVTRTNAIIKETVFSLKTACRPGINSAAGSAVVQLNRGEALSVLSAKGGSTLAAGMFSGFLIAHV